MAAPPYIVDGSPLRDPLFTAVISERMRVPERLRVTQGPVDDQKAAAEDLPAVFSMHVPDRLALTDAPDLSPQPLFSQNSPRGLASSMWNLHHGLWNGEAFAREHLQSPLRRSYSDQTFGRTPSTTPTHSKYFTADHSAGTTAAVPADLPLPEPQGLGDIVPILLTPQSILQAAKKLAKQASHRLLQAVSQKYSCRFGVPQKPPPPSQHAEERADLSRTSNTQEFCRRPEEESGNAVELMVLRRQMIKMNRRIASLEKRSADRKQSELVIFSLLLSACLINAFFWMRK